MKKIIFILILSAVLLIGCSSSQMKEVDSPDSIPLSDAGNGAISASNSKLNFFGQLSFGRGTGAPNSNGFYYVQPQKNGYANIMYIDYTTNSYLPLCSRPECKHNDESCTSFLAWVGGYPLLMTNSKYLIMLKSNVGMEYGEKHGEAALAHIEVSDLNGSNRKTVITLAANEDIQQQAACNDEFIYIVKSSIDEKMITTMSLCSISIATGELKEIYQLPSGTSFLIGAEDEYITVKCYSNPEDGSLYSDHDTQTFLCVNINTGACVSKNELPFSRDAAPIQTLVKGINLYLYYPEKDTIIIKNMLTGQQTNQFDNILEQAIVDGQLVDLFDDRLILEEVFSTDNGEKISYLWFNLSTCEKGSCEMMGIYSGTQRTFPLVPSCMAYDKMLIVYQFHPENSMIEGPGGEMMEVQFFQKSFALISPNDYFSEKPDFQQLQKAS